MPYALGQFRGIFPAVLTMFDKDNNLDENRTAKHWDWLIRQGVDGLVIAGTSGEFIALENHERLRLFELARDVAGGRVPLIYGSGHFSTKLTIEMSRKAQELGAAAVIVILPYYQKPSKPAVIRHFRDIHSALDLPIINDPGTKGYYCSGGVSVVGRMTENAVHMPLPEFAQKYLFGPLGMAHTDWAWNYDLTNADKEFSQIHLRSRDMLKLGILFEDGGRWHGRRIVSDSWVNTSTAEHSHVDNVSYGYFWWRHMFNVEIPGGAEQVVVTAAQGNGGQKIYIAPQYHLVAVFTGGGYNADSTPPNTIMEKLILPRLMQALNRTKTSSSQK